MSRVGMVVAISCVLLAGTVLPVVILPMVGVSVVMLATVRSDITIDASVGCNYTGSGCLIGELRALTRDAG